MEDLQPLHLFLSFLLSLLFSLPANADSVKLVYPSSQKEPAIPLKWEGHTFQVDQTPEAEIQGTNKGEGKTDTKADAAKANAEIKPETKTEPNARIKIQAELRGKFLENHWALIYMGRDQSEPTIVIQSTKKDESFVLHIPILGEKTHVTLMAVEPSGETQKDEFDLHYDHWNQTPQEFGCGTLFCLKSVQLSHGCLINSTGGLITGMVGWTPSFEKPWFRMRVHLGFSLLRNPSGTWYAALEYALLGSVKVYGPYWFEAFGGMQYWTDYPTHSPIIGGSAVYRFHKKVLSWIDQMSVGYGAFFPFDNLTHELRLGVGFSF